VRHEQLSFVVVRWVVRRFLIPLFADLRVTGLEHVPAEGPFIAAANHLSMADIPILMAVLPRRPSIMARDSLFEKPWLRPLLEWGDGIPVRRGAVDRQALRTAEERLSRGIPFGIFPEGTRIKTGALGPGKAGAGMIALRTGAPVLPVAFTGTHTVFRGRRPHFLRRPRATMTIGAPIPPRELAAAGGIEAATELIMRHIAALLPPEARGQYGDPAATGHVPGAEVSNL
jgi:1-acyl-sn-glycerol-3-phosphate acyltransferase